MVRITSLLLLLSTFSVGLHAQLPGGVSSPELWFKTQPTGTNLNGSYRWVDYSGDSLRLNDYDASGALGGDEYTTSTFRSYNGHPAISLDKLLDTKTREVMLKRTNLSQATVFGVFAPNANFNSEMLLYGLNGRGGQGIWLSTDKIYHSVQSGKSAFNYGETEGMDLMYAPGDVDPDVNRFREHSMSIVAYYRSITPSTGVWGERDKAVFSFGYYKSNNANNTSSFNIPSSANKQFSGYAPEFIAYNRLLTPFERTRVDSYLAIKYGLTLPVSYIGSKGQLLWDYAANPQFNNRITALYRDDISGLYQKESSTSYEEGPNYTDLVANDYYYQNNPNNRSSSSRLLVIGRGYANPLSDGSYMFWGDDNASVKLQDIEGIFGKKIMERQWLLKTNVVNAPESGRTLNWAVQNLNLNASGFDATVEKTISSNEESKTGYAYTQTPLLGSDGYIGISYSSLNGSVYLKFGGQGFTTAGGYDYGYLISSDNKVYLVTKGVISETSITTLIMTSRLEVEKRGNKIYLRIDGSRNSNSEIAIAPEDVNQSWYGSLAVTQGIFSTSFTLRNGGFTDTGNRVELSYARASEFKDNNRGRSYLVIDRSGTGNFTSGDVEYIPSDEVDASRQKVIFNNVFFDTDGNGTDAFTFAYGAPGISGEVELVEPDCNGDSNGEIIIKLTSGTPAFNYTLTDLATEQVVKSGKEDSYTIHLTDLPEGDYELNISEAGGFSFESTSASGTPTRAKTTNFFPVYEGSLEWRVSDLTDSYMVGYTTIAEDVNSTKNIIHYGLKKQGSALYKVLNGKLTALNVSVATDDILKVSKTMTGITYYKNGVQIGTASIGLLDYLLKFYGLIDMSEGPARILNVNAIGFFNLLDYKWNSMNNVKLSGSDNSSITYPVKLVDACGGQNSNSPQTTTGQIAPTVNNDLLKLIYHKGSLQVKAEIDSEEPLAVSFVVYNLQGQLVKQVSLTAPHKKQSANIHLPATGSYIIKAITSGNREYTKKFIVQ